MGARVGQVPVGRALNDRRARGVRLGATGELQSMQQLMEACFAGRMAIVMLMQMV